MAEDWRDILSAGMTSGTTAEEYRELDGDRVLVLTHSPGHGKTSGLTRLVLYPDGTEQALADLGLANEADSADST
jgi:hypothetical protein